ncbi:MAG: hypothetical protein J5526_00790 [Bacteroidales bacterium]|nr:hypothetical protein [Bacteroidales bacterium]
MTVVWFVVDMLSPRTYQTSVKISYAGIDTAHYVLSAVDDELPVSVTTDGFSALHYHLYWRQRPLSVDLAALARKVSPNGKSRLSVATDRYKDELQRRFSPIGGCEIELQQDSLSVLLDERCRKAYKPQLKDISFSFPDGYGLYGQASVTPDSVYLYGSEESLAKITALHTQPAKISVGKNGGHFQLKLEPEWRKFSDVRPSQESIVLTVPVEPYVEITQPLKVRIAGADSVRRVKLYPDEVTVSFWVPQSSYGKISANGCQAVVCMDGASASHDLKVTVTDFPSILRIKSVEPDKVQYVIIK